MGGDIRPDSDGHPGRDRRRSLRYPTSGRLVGTLLVHDLPVWVRDVGAGGFSIETMQPVTAGETEPVRFISDDNWSAVLEATSLYCRPSVSSDGLPRFVTGYKFVDGAEVDPTVRTLIEKVTSVRMSNGD